MADTAPGLRDDLVGRIYRRLDGGDFGRTSTDCIRAVLHAAEIDEARIRADEARATISRIVQWAGENAIDMGSVGRMLKPEDWRLVANAITREFGAIDKGGRDDG